MIVFSTGRNDMLKVRGLLPGGAVQACIDFAAASRTEPYVPYDTGALKNAPFRYLGEGEIRYDLPYAAKQYYENAGAGYQGTAQGGLRGPYFFERMKADHGFAILSQAAALCGARAERG